MTIMLFTMVSKLICNINMTGMHIPNPARIGNLPICNGIVKGLFISVFLYRRIMSEI